MGTIRDYPRRVTRLLNFLQHSKKYWSLQYKTMSTVAITASEARMQIETEEKSNEQTTEIEQVMQMCMKTEVQAVCCATIESSGPSKISKLKRQLI